MSLDVPLSFLGEEANYAALTMTGKGKSASGSCTLVLGSRRKWRAVVGSCKINGLDEMSFRLASKL